MSDPISLPPDKKDKLGFNGLVLIIHHKSRERPPFPRSLGMAKKTERGAARRGSASFRRIDARRPSRTPALRIGRFDRPLHEASLPPRARGDAFRL
jgi:hypothetical protein